MTETFAFLHGTTYFAHREIVEGGFAASNPARVAYRVEDYFGLRERAIWDHQLYSFPRKRHDLARVHFTTVLETARHYSIPEQVQDAFEAAYWIMFPPREDEGARAYTARKRPWIVEQARKMVGPGAVLKVELPWEPIGRGAFHGRVLTRGDFRRLLDDRLPETFSRPSSCAGSTTTTGRPNAGGPGAGPTSGWACRRAGGR